MKPTSAKQKGKNLENHVADQLRKKDIDQKAYRSHGSGAGNREKADIWTSATIFGRNLGIECKNQKNAHIKDWWKQTEKLCKVSREPVLVYSLQNENLDASKVVIYLDTFLDMVKALERFETGGEIIKDDSKLNRQIEYNAKLAKENINKILKDIRKE